MFKSGMASKSEIPTPPDISELSRVGAPEVGDSDFWPSGAGLRRRLVADPVSARPDYALRLGGLIPVGVYALVALAINYPLLRRGYPFAFDMSFGPVMRVPPEAYGLGGDFGRRLPTFLVLSWVSSVVSPSFIARAILFAIPFLAGLGMHRLSPAAREPSRYFAGLLFAVNPFVFERLVAGHWHILLGYALLGWALQPLLVWARDGHRNSLIKAGIWLGAIGLVSFAISTLAFVFAHAAALVLRRPGIVTRIRAFSGLTLMFLVTNATWIVAALVRLDDMGQFTQLDFRAFLVRGGSSWAAAGNVARLTGFFREDFRSPTLSSAAGLVLVAVIGMLVLLGVVSARRTKCLGPRMASLLLAVGAVALVAALGERAPLIGPGLGWLYARIPGMQIFRESQKIAGLLMFVYAIFGSLGADAVLASPKDEQSVTPGADGMRVKAGRIAMAVVVTAIPLAWTPGLLGGAGGRISVAEFPPGWHEADQALARLGEGRALVLPWHVHMPLSFTGGRTNLNPAGDFFSKELVQASAIEFPGFRLPADDPVDSYVRAAIEQGGLRSDFGAVVNPLGVDSILLLKEADWGDYGFLEEQRDIEKVLETESTVVYKTPANRGSLSRLASPGELTSIIPPDPLYTAYLASNLPGAGECPLAAGTVRRDEIYSYEVPGPGCWSLPETRSSGWVPAHLIGPANSGVSTAVRTGSPVRITYRPATLAMSGHAVSFVSILVLVATQAVDYFRTRRRSPKRSGRPGRDV